MLAPRTQPGEARLVDALAARLPGPVERLETHISWILLAGEHALKIKKPVNLGFADFTTLEERRRCCEEELRLGRRTAPELYEAVIPIAGTPGEPVLGGEGPAIEWALLMRRFPQEALLDRVAKAGALDAGVADALAAGIAQLHASVPRAAPGSPHGSPDEIRAEAERNFADLIAPERAGSRDERLAQLLAWTRGEGERLEAVFARRRDEGFVRECHGDLHLGNVALLGSRPVPFDAIEFNDALRWIDVMSEVAFPAMDLDHHGLPRLAHRFVDAYLSHTGDYGGLAVLRYYYAYRALVRAKVAAIRLRQLDADEAVRAERAASLARHVALAATVLEKPRSALVAMHGLPGSGKTTVSQELLETLGAIRVRSDVERKRVHGLDPLARTASPPGAGLYGREADERTRTRLLEAAGEVLAAGRIAIVDATTATRESRAVLRELARSRNVPFVIVSCEATPEMLRERIAARERKGGDASEAGLAVLDHQMVRFEPLTKEEAAEAIIVDSARGSGRSLTPTEGVRARIS